MSIRDTENGTLLAPVGRVGAGASAAVRASSLAAWRAAVGRNAGALIDLADVFDRRSLWDPSRERHAAGLVFGLEVGEAERVSQVEVTELLIGVGAEVPGKVGRLRPAIPRVQFDRSRDHHVVGRHTPE